MEKKSFSFNSIISKAKKDPQPDSQTSEKEYKKMLGVFKNYYFINKQLMKKAKEMDTSFKAAVAEMFSEDFELESRTNSFNSLCNDKKGCNEDIFEIERQDRTPDKKTFSYMKFVQSALEQLHITNKQSSEMKIHCQESQLTMSKAFDMIEGIYGPQNLSEELQHLVQVKKQYSFESSESIYFTKTIRGNKYVLFQNRQDFKIMIMDCQKLQPLKNVYYGINETLKYVFESSDCMIFVLNESILLVDSDNFRSKVKKQLKYNISKIENLSDDLIIATTQQGFILLIGKKNLEVIFEKKVTDSYIYDIEATSRRNEWALFTHEGLVFISWVKQYGSDSYDLVSLHEKTLEGSMITGIEITPEVFLLKQGSTKNLGLYNRKTKVFTNNYISNLNEYTSEFVLVPGYNYTTNPYIIARTNTSLKLINIVNKKAYFLVDLGLYQSHLNGALHVFHLEESNLEVPFTLQVIATSNIETQLEGEKTVNSIYRIEINKELFKHLQ